MWLFYHGLFLFSAKEAEENGDEDDLSVSRPASGAGVVDKDGKSSASLVAIDGAGASRTGIGK